MQQPRAGMPQYDWNRSVEKSLQTLSDNMQSLTDTLKARNDEMVEVGKLIQQELDKNSDDVEALRQKVNKLQAESQARKDAPVEHDPVPWPMIGLLMVGVGILAVYCVRLWFDLRLMRLIPVCLPREETLPPNNHTVVAENSRPLPDPAIR